MNLWVATLNSLNFSISSRVQSWLYIVALSSLYLQTLQIIGVRAQSVKICCFNFAESGNFFPQDCTQDFAALCAYSICSDYLSYLKVWSHRVHLNSRALSMFWRILGTLLGANSLLQLGQVEFLLSQSLRQLWQVKVSQLAHLVGSLTTSMQMQH